MNTSLVTTLYNGIKAEYYKAKDTKLLLITLAVPVFVSICTFLICKNFPAKTIATAPWHHLQSATQALLGFNTLLIAIIGMISLAVQTENKANAWKQLLIMPIPRWTIYISKYLFILLLIVGIYSLIVLFFLFNGWLLGIIRPETNFSQQSPDLYVITGSFAKIFLSVLSVTAIQYWFSLRVKNYMLPIFIGGFAVMIFTFAAVLGWSKSVYIPYAYVSVTNMFMDGKINQPIYWGLPQHLWFSIIGFVIISILAIIDAVFKRIKES